MDRLERLMANVSFPSDSRLRLSYRAGQAHVELGDSRDQTVYIEREGDTYVFTSVVLGTTRAEQQRKDVLLLAERLWYRNRQTEFVNFTFDSQNRLVGRIEHLAHSLDADALIFYLSRLAIECDRMEYLLTGENRL